MTTSAPPAPPVADTIRAASVELARLLQQLDRPDLVERVSAAAARLQRPATIVAVVGEFKQGKSSLVNGLLGQAVCPVDDDLATSAITVVRYGEQPGAVLRSKDAPVTNDEPVVQQAPPAAAQPSPQVDVERLKAVRHTLASLLED